MSRSTTFPRTTMHVAQSLDGKIALLGTRTDLSSEEGWCAAHRARAEHDAVLVGSATVRLDDPRLTVRKCAGSDPRRIVLASSLELPLTARLFTSSQAPVLVIGVVGRASERNVSRVRETGAEVRLVEPAEDGLVSLSNALGVIRDWGVERLLIEGGARVLTSFLREGLLDEASIEIVPRVFGAQGVALVGDLGVLEEMPRLADVQFDRAGTSVILRGRFVH